MPALVPGAIDQHAAHRLRRGGKEVPTAIELLTPDESQVCFVDQGGGVECLARGFADHAHRGEHQQLVVKERKQLRRGLAIARRGGLEELGHIGHHGSGQMR